MPKPLIHEAVFALGFDLKTAMSDAVKKLDIGLTAPHLRALRLIWSGDNVTSQEISQSLRRDKAQVARIVSELLNRKLVRRIENPDDKRSQFLVVTAKGSEIFESVAKIEIALQDVVLQGISAKDVATFVKVAKQVSENIRNIESDKK